jgi:hypothetical protein
MIVTEARGALKVWKSVMTGGVYDVPFSVRHHFDRFFCEIGYGIGDCTQISDPTSYTQQAGDIFRAPNPPSLAEHRFDRVVSVHSSITPYLPGLELDGFEVKGSRQQWQILLPIFDSGSWLGWRRW